MRIFDRDKQGMLFEVTQEEAKGRRYSREVMAISVLFTPEQEARRDAEHPVLTSEPNFVEELHRLRKRIAELEGQRDGG